MPRWDGDRGRHRPGLYVLRIGRRHFQKGALPWWLRCSQTTGGLQRASLLASRIARWRNVPLSNAWRGGVLPSSSCSHSLWQGAGVLLTACSTGCIQVQFPSANTTIKSALRIAKRRYSIQNLAIAGHVRLHLVMQCCAYTTRKVAHSQRNMSEQDEQVVRSEGGKAAKAAASLTVTPQTEASPACVHEYAAQMVRILQNNWCSGCTLHQLRYAMHTPVNMHRHHRDGCVVDFMGNCCVRLHATMTRLGWRSASVPTAPRYGLRYVHRKRSFQVFCVPSAALYVAGQGRACSITIHRCSTWTLWMQQISPLTSSGSATRCGPAVHMCSIDASQTLMAAPCEKPHMCPPAVGEQASPGPRCHVQGAGVGLGARLERGCAQGGSGARHHSCAHAPTGWHGGCAPLYTHEYPAQVVACQTAWRLASAQGTWHKVQTAAQRPPDMVCPAVCSLATSPG